MVSTANVQILLEVEGPMFYLCLFVMSQLDVNGWFIVFCLFHLLRAIIVCVRLRIGLWVGGHSWHAKEPSME